MSQTPRCHHPAWFPSPSSLLHWVKSRTSNFYQASPSSAGFTASARFPCAYRLRMLTHTRCSAVCSHRHQHATLPYAPGANPTGKAGADTLHFFFLAAVACVRHRQRVPRARVLAETAGAPPAVAPSHRLHADTHLRARMSGLDVQSRVGNGDVHSGRWTVGLKS